MEAYNALPQHVNIKKTFQFAGTDFKIYVLLTRCIIFNGWFLPVMTRSASTLN